MERTVEVVFAELPETLEAMKRLSQASLSTPFDTAALTVAALAVYPKDREMSRMLRGRIGSLRLGIKDRAALYLMRWLSKMRAGGGSEYACK